MKKQIDYKYTRKFLERLNSIVVDTPLYNQHFIFEGSDMWYSYQQCIFSDAKLFSIDRKLEDVIPSASLTIKIRGVLLTFLSLIYSLLTFFTTFILRPKIAIYSVDKISGKYKNDFRINAIYDALHGQNAKYVEFFHTIFGRQFLINLWSRARWSVYLESLDILAWVMRPEAIPENFIPQSFGDDNERKFAEFIIQKYIINARISRIRVSILRSIIKLSGIKVVLSIDDTRYYQDLVKAAHVSGIKFYAFQHGHVTKYQVGWLKMYQTKFSIIKPDIIYVWNEYWKEEFIKLGSIFDPAEIQIAVPSNLIPKNLPNQDTIHTSGIDQNSLAKLKKGILLPYETDAPKEETVKHVRNIIKFGYTIYFKLRQDMDAHQQILDYGFNQDEVIPVTKLDDVNGKIALVIGTYSTFLYDMVYQKIPVAILDTSMDYGYGMVRNNLADLIPVDITPEAFSNIININKETVLKRYDKLQTKSDQTIDSVITKIASNI